MQKIEETRKMNSACLKDSGSFCPFFFSIYVSLELLRQQETDLFVLFVLIPVNGLEAISLSSVCVFVPGKCGPLLCFCGE